MVRNSITLSAPGVRKTLEIGTFVIYRKTGVLKLGRLYKLLVRAGHVNEQVCVVAVAKKYRVSDGYVYALVKHDGR